MIIFLTTEIPKTPSHPENMKDSAGKEGQHTSKKVFKMMASFSGELLAHRCGISDVIFERGCVILDNLLRQRMPKTRMYRNAR